MDKKDKLMLRLLTITWLVFTVILAYIGFTLFTNTTRDTHNLIISIDNIKKDIDIKNKELEKITDNIKSLKPLAGMKGDKGDTIIGPKGEDSMSTHTETIVDNQTIIEKQVPIKGDNGLTPLVAFDEGLKRWMVRYRESEEWSLAPVLCFGISGSCGEPN
jgi:hypothetical protein